MTQISRSIFEQMPLDRSLALFRFVVVLIKQLKRLLLAIFAALNSRLTTTTQGFGFFSSTHTRIKYWQAWAYRDAQRQAESERVLQ
jgi:hypothetical protein